MSKTIRYRKATRERLIELLERIGYKVTNQSTDGTWKLIRLPDGTSTDYWIFSDRIEHRLRDNRGGSYFNFKDCYFSLDDDTTVAVIVSGLKGSPVFVQFHNFEAHRNRQREVNLEPMP